MEELKVFENTFGVRIMGKVFSQFIETGSVTLIPGKINRFTQFLQLRHINYKVKPFIIDKKIVGYTVIHLF